MARGRFAALDGLRALAVLLVFASHAAERLLIGGWIGVDLFFVLSGYLITKLLLDEWDHAGTVRFGAFYARRFLRLMPALLVLVLLTLPLALRGATGRAIPDALAALLYLTDIYEPLTGHIAGMVPHTWSLAVEEQFYLVWPALLVLALRRRWAPARFAVGLLVLSVAATVVTVAMIGPFLAYRSPFPHAPELLAGVGLALAARSNAPQLGWLRFSWLAPALTLAMIASAFVLDPHARWLFFGGFVVLALPLAALVGAVVTQPESSAARALSAGPLVWLGQRSYGFYLWHFPVLVVVTGHVHDRRLAAALGLVLSLGVTALSWRFVEEPFLRLKRRFEPASRGPVTASVSSGA